MSKLRKRFGLIALILIAGIAISYSILSGLRKDTETLSVSGTVEVIEVLVVGQTEGWISAVMVGEGDHVQAGDVLVRFQDDVLQTQFEQAETALTQAKIDYDFLAAQPLREQRGVDIAAAQLELLNAQQALQNLVDDTILARAYAGQAVENAEEALDDLYRIEHQQAVALENLAVAEQAVDQAEKYLTIVSSPPPQSAIDQAYANMLIAEKKLNDTLEAIGDIEWQITKVSAIRVPKDAPDQIRSQVKELRSEAMKGLRQAFEGLELKRTRDQLAYNRAETKYNNLLEPPDATDVAVAEAEYLVAQAALAQAQREYARVKDGPSDADIAVLQAKIDLAKREYRAHEEGPDPDDLALAQARVKRAKANLALAQADTIQEQLAVAQARIDSAEADLNLIQTQLDKLVLTAPVGGTVLHRFVETGETIVPGRPVFSLANLDDLDLTIYIPEENRREIDLGDRVSIRVNAFPKERFEGMITHIDCQASYTPLSVQHAEGRRTNVCAVKLTVSDPAGRIKPGMPVGVSLDGR
jgi:HlyD family secretion protein